MSILQVIHTELLPVWMRMQGPVRREAASTPPPRTLSYYQAQVLRHTGGLRCKREETQPHLPEPTEMLAAVLDSKVTEEVRNEAQRLMWECQNHRDAGEGEREAGE